MKKAKSLPKLKAELQLIFNEWIRLRDSGQPCISCGQIKPLQAGHYFPVQGYDGLRYNPLNVNGECSYDNCFNESHLINYGINLKNKIGESAYNELIQQAENYKKYGSKFSRTELLEMIAFYKNEIKNLKLF